MSLREKIDSIIYDVIAYGPTPVRTEPITNDILAAIEAERPSIEAAERERLAKAAEGMALIEPVKRPVWLTNDEWIAVAGWIRSASGS